MAEFERTPESMRAELAGLDAEYESLTANLATSRQQLERGEITQEEYDARDRLRNVRAETVKKNALEILLAMGEEGTGEIRTRLASYADSIAEEMGEEMPISASEMLYSVFGTNEAETLSPKLVGILEGLKEKYPILDDEEAAENEYFAADGEIDSIAE